MHDIKVVVNKVRLEKYSINIEADCDRSNVPKKMCAPHYTSQQQEVGK